MAVSGKLGGLVGEIPDVTHDPRETSGQLVAGQFGPDYHTSPHSIWLLSKVSTTDRQVNLMYLQNFENLTHSSKMCLILEHSTKLLCTIFTQTGKRPRKPLPESKATKARKLCLRCSTNISLRSQVVEPPGVVQCGAHHLRRPHVQLKGDMGSRLSQVCWSADPVTSQGEIWGVRLQQ